MHYSATFYVLYNISFRPYEIKKCLNNYDGHVGTYIGYISIRNGKIVWIHSITHIIMNIHTVDEFQNEIIMEYSESYL